MKTILSFWKTSPPEHKDYLFIYAWGALWASVYLIATPPSTTGVFGATLAYTWCLTMVVGGALGVAGLLRRDNLILERLGISLLMTGPIAFGLTQLGLIIYEYYSPGENPISRVHLIFLALWPYLFLNKRRRQLKNRVRLLKKIPLGDETV